MSVIWSRKKNKTASQSVVLYGGQVTRHWLRTAALRPAREMDETPRCHASLCAPCGLPGRNALLVRFVMISALYILSDFTFPLKL